MLPISGKQRGGIGTDSRYFRCSPIQRVDCEPHPLILILGLNRLPGKLSNFDFSGRRPATSTIVPPAATRIRKAGRPIVLTVFSVSSTWTGANPQEVHHLLNVTERQAGEGTHADTAAVRISQGGMPSVPIRPTRSAKASGSNSFAQPLITLPETNHDNRRCCARGTRSSPAPRRAGPSRRHDQSHLSTLHADAEQIAGHDLTEGFRGLVRGEHPRTHSTP